LKWLLRVAQCSRCRGKMQAHSSPSGYSVPTLEWYWSLARSHDRRPRTGWDRQVPSFRGFNPTPAASDD